MSTLSDNSAREARSSVLGTVTSTNWPTGDRFSCLRTSSSAGVGTGGEVGVGVRVGDDELTLDGSASRSTITSSMKTLLTTGPKATYWSLVVLTFTTPTGSPDRPEGPQSATTPVRPRVDDGIVVPIAQRMPSRAVVGGPLTESS